MKNPTLTSLKGVTAALILLSAAWATSGGPTRPTARPIDTSLPIPAGPPISARNPQAS
ncbi:MAG: hypothetical protein JO317_09355 [Verrucomicrobiae bacterium]|nr:hypothetical protein [Verrucomicrobiae bacterium]